MNSSLLPNPVLVTRPSDLRKMVDVLTGETILAVDTESNSLYAYQERVCLIQFSTLQMDYLVDPLAVDVKPLSPVFANPQIEKIFHAAEYDLITLKRDYNFTFTNLFDTMVAARILGWDEVGLGAILKTEFGVQLDKRYQRANWGQRPLPHDLLAYARLDTHYLIALQQRLKAHLEAGDRWPLAQEDFHRLQEVNGRDPAEQPDLCWRISGAYDLSPQQAAILRELCIYREQVAKTIDKPVFKVIGDKMLLAIAQNTPKDIAEMRRIPEVNPKIMERHSEGLIRSVRLGLRSAPIYPPRTTRPDEAYLARLDALRTWRKIKGQKLGVGSDVILPRDRMYALAAQNPQNLGELVQVLDQLPWRLEHFGEEILITLSRKDR
jgi:ribonuclease D